MRTRHSDTNSPRAGVKQYRIVNHKEAGMFDSMTGATLWALRNLEGWDWRIELAPNSSPK